MNKRKRLQENLTGYAFLSPAIIIFLALVILPLIMSVGLSFTKWNFLSGAKGIKFVGVDNFIKLYTRDRAFLTALKNTFIYVITIVPLSTFLGLILAYFFTRPMLYFKRFFRFAFFIPYISNMVALGAVFKFLFRSDGIINDILLRLFGVSESQIPNWMTDSFYSKIPIIAVMIYTGLGFCMLIYIAALQDVSKDLYEAATIDGANSFKQFWRITFPLISPTTFYLLIVRMINTFQLFVAINIISSSSGKTGGNVSMVVLVYEEAFKNYNFGYASAISWNLVFIILIVTLLQMWIQKKWVFYE